MTQAVPDSKSVVLRSTHIVRLRVLRFQATPWELDANRAFNRRRAVIQFAWVETLKGEVTPPDPPPVVISVSQYENAGLLMLPTPGVYSLIGPETGKEFVVFSRAQSLVPAEILREQVCDQVQPAENVLTGVRLAVDAIRRDLGVVPLLDEARPHAPSLSALFADFVWERYQREILSAPAAYRAYLSFLEQPALATIARSVLLNDVYSAVSNGTRPGGQVDLLARAMFRLLALPEAQPLRDGLLQVLLPNLLGLQGGAPQHSAAEVFHDAPNERPLAKQTLAQYKGTADPSQLISWLQ